ncbi:MAG: hypothetical protein KC620_09735 [Myxococcales bacterium]|nr:hypothetical protein [Myxococcales bacterium]
MRPEILLFVTLCLGCAAGDAGGLDAQGETLDRGADAPDVRRGAPDAGALDMAPVASDMASGTADMPWVPLDGGALDGAMPPVDMTLAVDAMAVEDAAARMDMAAQLVDGGVEGPGDLPLLHDLSGAPPDRVEALVRRALDGLGMHAATGPSPADRVVITPYLLAWIDQTGFPGKLNGLWTLNGDRLDLDFVLLDGERPINQLVPGENGDGRWPAGYPGAEHIEFPNRTPEANDNPACADRDWCNQYGVAEADPITDGDIPWWSACNRARPGFDARFEPVEVTPRAGGLTLWYAAPLVKMADGDGRYDGDDCGADYLFADGIRHRVWLRLGYEFDATESHLDRLVQVENPAQNPAFDGPMSFIGGFVITRWPQPHPSKSIDRFWRAESRDGGFRWGDVDVRLPAGQWVDLTGYPRFDRQDVIIAWAGQPLSFSDRAAYATGRALTLSHVGPGDNDDVGACLCAVHGGLELGGGLLHGGIALPVPPGERSMVARRRLTLRREAPPPMPRRIVYEAEGPELRHNLGRADGDGWSAATDRDSEGHLIFGPYARDWGEGRALVGFRLLVDVVNAADDEVVVLDVYDADADQILASTHVRRRSLPGPFAYADFVLAADLAGRAGHAIETRVWWTDRSYVRVDRVEVVLDAQ